ncbi:RNA 2',3'-cyclic phosphodiesterase [Vibrio sp. ZSDZ34]|jgi:2'-5' RNA ligase|uniref:RNA 2',3'-cyclic phosphodiesterase n=1 Tax=Vibrio gelatinilyticus TaxID=2893468 RepID=A0A9X1WB46_9VIBR|nr:RNA 2',3'-cyclic phosphodiesterase [Vibrio gelatinilyticus]MCJ2376954.1 RNA 2',3'-cyclic phosphodiesterase [Vibrio gelatinilyticus]
MRLFFALTFDDLSKKKLAIYQQVLHKHDIKGRDTRTENFHITLAFIGESSSAQQVALRDILQQLTAKCEPILIDHLGSFRLKAGRLVWAGIADNPVLSSLQSQLSSKLVEGGFLSESRTYIPHITLARQVRGNAKLEQISIEPYLVQARSVALMSSHHIDNQIVYQIVDEWLC